MPLSTPKKVVTGVAAAAVTGLLVIGGATLASAADETSPSSSSSSSSTSDGGRAPHDHTPVTGDEATKVSAAVTAKDSAVTVTSVQKDPDGSYDVDGTKAGAQVRFDVSADLATVTERTGGPGGGKGGHGGGSQDTPVTGDEATKVSAAVTAKDSAVTVTSVQKDPDGSYDVDATRAGAQVRFDVSADLATVTERTGGPGGGKGGHGARGDGDGSSGATDGSTSGAQQSSSSTSA